MRHNWILLILVFALCNACKQKTIDFSYSPTQPRAGQSVAFTNGCDFGEEWAWNFGDNTFSTLKTPSHTFRKPGTYTVTLMVDSTARHSISKTIEVVDTLPTIGCAEDSILYLIRLNVLHLSNLAVELHQLIESCDADLAGTGVVFGKFFLVHGNHAGDADGWNLHKDTGL